MVVSFPLRDHELLYLGIGLVLVALGVGFEGFGLKLSRTEPTAEFLAQREGEDIRIQRIVAEVPQKNDDFVGRQKEMQALRDNVMSGRRTVLWGLGGVGKSQLAVQYISRYKAEYQGRVFWVRATDATLGSDYTALSLLLDLKEKIEPEQSVVAAAVKRWLRDEAPWLLVFDNAEDPQTLSGFLPEAGSGHVLITSRSAAWPGFATVPIEPLPPKDGTRFMLRSARQDDQASASMISGLLGHLPLALNQAAAYALQRQMPLSEYASLLQERLDDVLHSLPGSAEEQRVTSTWGLSLEQVAKRSPAAEELLRVCSFLGAESIPLELMTNPRFAFPLPKRRYLIGSRPSPLAVAVRDPLQLNDAIGVLLRFSLLTRRHNGVLDVHLLVQAVVRRNLDDEARARWAGVALAAVRAAYPENGEDVGTWSICAALVPHALAAVGHAERTQTSAGDASWLLDGVARYLQSRAEFARSKANYERALAIAVTAHGPDHPVVGTLLNNLGSVLQELGDLQGARAHYERAVAIALAAYGPDHVEVGSDLNNLGSVLTDLGDLQGARAHYERAVAIALAAYGPDHPVVGTYLNNLGGVLQDLADLQGARTNYERALAIDLAAYGAEHPVVGSDLNNLGSVLTDLGDLQGARANFERALAIALAAYGSDHPMVSTRLNNLGSVLKDLGDLQGTRSNLERALAIDLAAYGVDHSTVAIDLNNLGLVLKELGDLPGAKANFERALAIDLAAYGPDHPVVGTLLNNLGLVLKELGDLPGAKANFERALAIDLAAYGPDHPDVGMDLNNLGLVLNDLGDLHGARANFERSLGITLAAYGPDHRAVSTNLNNLGSVLQDLGDLQGAKANFERALAIDLAAYGPDHPDVGMDLNNLASTLHDLGDLPGARANLERSLAIALAAYGPDHPTPSTIAENLEALLGPNRQGGPATT